MERNVYGSERKVLEANANRQITNKHQRTIYKIGYFKIIQPKQEFKHGNRWMTNKCRNLLYLSFKLPWNKRERSNRSGFQGEMLDSMDAMLFSLRYAPTV
jgi:hypothetical protein